MRVALRSAPSRLARFAVVAGLLAAACGRAATPEDVALEYARAVYANDADAIWRLVSDADRRVKDVETFRRQQRQLAGFTRDVVSQLARLIAASPVTTSYAGERASVTLRFRLPDANAPEIRGLLHEWDEQRLNRLSDDERRSIHGRLAQLQRNGKVPTIEGDETVELVREYSRWKVFLNWAGGVRVRFHAMVEPGVPLEVTVAPTSVVLGPGERIHVTVQARNIASQEVTTRVGHQIEPKAQAAHLALLQCPLFVPVTLKPGASEEFTSEYLLLTSVSADTKSFDVAYTFPAGDHATRR